MNTFGVLDYRLLAFHARAWQLNLIPALIIGQPRHQSFSIYSNLYVCNFFILKNTGFKSTDPLLSSS